jgi:hypothetical protein
MTQELGSAVPVGVDQQTSELQAYGHGLAALNEQARGEGAAWRALRRLPGVKPAPSLKQ